MNYYTFDDLKDLSLRELNEIRGITADTLAAERQKRWDAIASILFYQDQIKKERGHAG